MLYRIQNQEFDYIQKYKYIVITHMTNLVQKGSYIKFNILNGTYRYTWHEWQNYFHKELLQKKLPIHFFAELLNKDYVINIACPQVTRSTFLKELSDNYIIEYDMRDALLIGIQENYSIEIPETRLFQHLSDKLLSDLMRRYSIPRNNILLFDEILRKDWEENLVKYKIPYTFKPMNYFNKDALFFTLNTFIKG